MERVNENVLAEIKKLGAFDLEACYSCGTCSAICPLSKDAASFPRRMIRYSLLGLEKRILSAPEPWLCYYCGECSDSAQQLEDLDYNEFQAMVEDMVMAIDSHLDQLMPWRPATVQEGT